MRGVRTRLAPGILRYDVGPMYIVRYLNPLHRLNGCEFEVCAVGGGAYGVGDRLIASVNTFADALSITVDTGNQA